METVKTTVIYFSPTGGTRRVAELLASEVANRYQSIDITVSGDTLNFASDDLVIIAVPVYGGRVPSPAKERLEHINGAGAMSVLVAVFGNRAVDDALLELKELAQSRGFVCVAAGAFIAPHSVGHAFGAGRPDASDLSQMRDFATHIREKLGRNDFSSVGVPGASPYKQYHGIPLKPYTKEAACSRCGACARGCPAGAIPPENPLRTDGAKCISCMRCISLCPHQARRLHLAMRVLSKAALYRYCSRRREPEWIV
jgi:Dissimilatory sulfite reductase (desulfoviridin), alpha and beta subunits